MIVDTLQQVQSDNTLGPPIQGPNGQFAVDQSFSAQITAFPGRQSAVQVFLDDAMLNIDSGGNAAFNRSLFLQSNTTADNPNVVSFLSDYVEFDISKVAAPPKLADGSVGTRVYMSGDKFAISGSAFGGPFQVYTPGNPLTGTFAGPGTVNPFGTYSLREPDPRDLTLRAKITSLQGIWRPVNTVISGLGAFEVILFPHSQDDSQQDVAVMVTDANGNLTNMYFGVADLTAKTFVVYPIAQVETGDASNAITGNLSGLMTTTGATAVNPADVRSGRYTFTGAVPAGFKASGRFIVFRR